MIEEALEPGKACRVLLDGASPLGWVAAGTAWGRVWELHPLLIDPDHQRRGYGRLLANDIERFAINAVGYTLVGVLPDAEGPGMPSISLAKRLS